MRKGEKEWNVADWKRFAKIANVKHSVNCTSTPLCLPRRTEGINDDNKKIHAKE